MNNYKTKYFSGGPPQWTFLDEVWRNKQEKLQKSYHESFKQRVATRKKEQKGRMYGNHRKIIAMVGPAWYQELSPKQLSTVDDLKNCISKDLTNNTLINTKENIAALGLVLRPNEKLIKKALINCCKCPVEFLLILYQLINPKRESYSINDRLLLSAVVHLTMKDTLRELHVRIPSPPPQPKNCTKIVKKKKKPKYESPYLEPFNFTKEPPTFVGIYYNKHVQRPQSPYFCYLEDLKKMQLTANCRANNNNNQEDKNIEDEIEKELILAQSIYEQLVDFRPVPILLKPSKFIPCDNFRNRQMPPSDLQYTEEEETEDVVYDNTPCFVPEEQSCCDAATEITEEELTQNTSGCSSPNKLCGEQTAGCEPQEPSTCSKNEEQCNEKAFCYDEQPVPKTACRDESASKFPKMKKEQCVSPKPLCEPVNEKKQKFCVEENESNNKKTCKHAKELALYDWYCEYKNRKKEDKTSCHCKEKNRQLIEKPFCSCEKCEEERRNKSIIYAVSGLKETDSKEMVPIIDRVIPEKPCKCLENYEKKIKQYELERANSAKKICDCYKETRKIIETPFCTCEKCQEDRKTKASNYIIGGIKNTESDNKICLVEGISLEKPCKCQKNYEKRIAEYEWFQKRQKLVCGMKQQEHKYIIGGVVNTAQGPVYIISGMRPPIDCICCKKAREEEKEKRMQAIMPHIPEGRVKYGIIGVKETPEGNVYILGNAIPIEDCECMTLFEKYKQQHHTCIQLYEDYLAEMKDVYNAFMEDMLPPSSSRKSSVRSSRFNSVNEEYLVPELNIGTTDQEKIEEEDKQDTITNDNEATIIPNKIHSEITTNMDRKSPAKQPKLCQYCRQACGVQNYYSERCSCGKVECKGCVCGKIIECVDCTCGPKEVEEEEVVEEEEEKLKRFFIFKKISCKRRWQMSIIKKALESMAEDGYPLAKLPDSYKLPHFKLWMYMRCGKFWTLNDKYEYVVKSKNMWRHCDICDVRKNKLPILPVSIPEAKFLDWSKAAYVRKMVNDALEKFYRKVKQNQVNFGREYFASTFTYEFPFKTWRDCYFAYTPTKEEEVLARDVWQKYEFKNFADMQRFCG